jgi:hypothetical protein
LQGLAKVTKAQYSGDSAAGDAIITVIPGRCAASNPESRDSGFALTRAPE